MKNRKVCYLIIAFIFIALIGENIMTNIGYFKYSMNKKKYTVVECNINKIYIENKSILKGQYSEISYVYNNMQYNESIAKCYGDKAGKTIKLGRDKNGVLVRMEFTVYKIDLIQILFVLIALGLIIYCIKSRRDEMIIEKAKIMYRNSINEEEKQE